MTNVVEQDRIEAEIDRIGLSSDPFASAVRATRMPMIISDPHGADNPIVFVNDAFCRLTGYGREKILGRNCRFLQGPETDRSEVARVREAIAERRPVEAELLNYKKSGETFWNRLLVSPVFDDEGALTYFFASQYETTNVRTTQIALGEAEQRLDLLIRSSSEVRFTVNADWSELHNLAGGEFIPDTPTTNRDWLREYIPAEDREAVQAEFERAIRTKSTYLSKHRVNRVDGTVGWALSRAVPLLDPSGDISGWFGAATDVTAQEEAEAALRASEGRLRTSEAYWRGLFERLNEGFMIVEVVRGADGVARTWRFLELNDAWERISGLSRATASGRCVDEVIPGVEREWIDAYIRVAETGEAETFRMPLKALGHVYEVRAFFVAPERVGVLFQEISVQQREEARRAALLELNDRLRDLGEGGEPAAAAAEALGRALDVERAGYASMHGDGRTVVVERDWTAPGLVSLAGRHRIDDFGRAVSDLHLGAAVVIEDTSLDPRIAEEGAATFEALSVRSLVNVPLVEDGRLVAFFFVNDSASRSWSREDVAFVRDVAERTRATSERRRAERELRELAASLERQVEERTRELADSQAALAQSQKMEAVGQLTGGLAHDFNNLLAGISGSLELMQSRMQQGRFNDVERYMAAAQGASKRAAALTHRLLAFSRRQTLDPKPTDVNRLVAGMHEMIQRTVGPGIPVEVVGVSGLWPALVDPPQLENALLNLCINARDAMPNGGRITIETANKWLDGPAAQRHEVPEGQYLSMCVTDTGTGMSPDVIARVFEPFFTTKPIGEGTGLGLSMIYGFAQQSGGQVRIYSEVDQGTTVCIYLPRHYGEVGDDGGVEAARALPRSDQGETVLVVDDEPTVRMLLTDILGDLGYSSIEAADSAAGLKVLQSDVRIDLLVTDVGLPGGMNGRQMADAARVSRPDLKVLFITGYAENAILGNGHLAPGMAVLTKPFAIEAMAMRIRSIIEAA